MTMKKIAALAAAGTLAISLGGCGYIQQVTGLTPAEQVAFVKAVPCKASAGALAAQGVEAKTIDGQPIADQKAQDITELVYFGSTATCLFVGGTPQAPVSVPSTAVASAPAAQ